MTTKHLPTPEVLRQLIRYEPDSGRLYWKKRDQTAFAEKDGRPHPIAQCWTWNDRYAGRAAMTSRSGHGYLEGYFTYRNRRVRLRAHRVAWAVHYGYWPKNIDHINGDKADNRITNLRDVTGAENSKNRAINKNNTSGVTGVSPCNGRWRAEIRADGVRKHIGVYDTIKQAARARKRVERRLGFHENHGRKA